MIFRLQAIPEAFQHLDADSLYDTFDRLRVELPARYVLQRTDDGGSCPRFELLCVAHLLFFGHIFVPFGKLECFGDGQLALLTARQVKRPHARSCQGSASRQAVRRPPLRSLDRSGSAATMEDT